MVYLVTWTLEMEIDKSVLFRAKLARPTLRFIYFAPEKFSTKSSCMIYCVCVCWMVIFNALIG